MVFTPFGDLDGATEPILIWHSPFFEGSLYFSYKSEAQTQLSHASPRLPLLCPNCLFGILSQPAKWGWVSFLGTSVSEDHWFPSVLMKCLWSDEMLLGARSPPSSRTGLCFPISPLGWRDCRCLFCWWPILTMIYLWALVPGLTLAPVQPPVWYCKFFPLMLVGMKGT